ncbi:MAG: SDR family oxidoreductase [Thermoleophilaceae bacterium]|nr:SDR family oxidoreductase [Thermoleophilaceae bacterium]
MGPPPPSSARRCAIERPAGSGKSSGVAGCTGAVTSSPSRPPHPALSATTNTARAISETRLPDVQVTPPSVRDPSGRGAGRRTRRGRVAASGRHERGKALAERAALITGGSSGIGLAVARMLGQEGYGLTVSARRPDKLDSAAEELRGEGLEVESVPTNMVDEQEIKDLVAAHQQRFGRLDVLVNNAGVGIGGPVAEHETKKLDMQINVNLRAVFLTTREALPMLKEAGGEHGKALIANTASIAGKHGEGWLAAYSATKAGVVGLTQALHKEHGEDGIQATALCPAFVATPMTDWVDGVPKEEMIQPEDIAEAVRYLLRTSPACIVPEMQFIRPGDAL